MYDDSCVFSKPLSFSHCFLRCCVMNQYEVVHQIGEGAFGKAFLALDRDRHWGGESQCVVKEINLRKVPTIDLSVMLIKS